MFVGSHIEQNSIEATFSDANLPFGLNELGEIRTLFSFQRIQRLHPQLAPDHGLTKHNVLQSS
jgi:hypothetical protein